MDGSELYSAGRSLFRIGLAGFSMRNADVIRLLISLEVMLLGTNLLFLSGSLAWDDLMGQVVVLFVLTVAAAEAAIGLAILVAYSKVRGSVELEGVALLHG